MIITSRLQLVLISMWTRFDHYTAFTASWNNVKYRYMLYRIFLDFFHRPLFKKTLRFGNWICFRPQVKVGEKTPTQLGPLERELISITGPMRKHPVSETSCFWNTRRWKNSVQNSVRIFSSLTDICFNLMLIVPVYEVSSGGLWNDGLCSRFIWDSYYPRNVYISVYRCLYYPPVLGLSEYVLYIPKASVIC
jgi:hypothetical protein